MKYTAIALESGRVLHRKRFESIDDAVEWVLENPYCLVELTLVSNTFFATQDLKRIHESHDGIIFIIPVLIKNSSEELQIPKVNLEQDIQGLFADYFKSKHKQKPNEELLDLFNEIVGSQAKNE